MKIFAGQVIAKRKDKTAVVVTEKIAVHPLYKKRYKRTKKYQVHDEIGTKVGEKVEFIAGKPVSKTKKWRILRVLEKGKGAVKKP